MVFDPNLHLALLQTLQPMSYARKSLVSYEVRDLAVSAPQDSHVRVRVRAPQLYSRSIAGFPQRTARRQNGLPAFFSTES